MNGKSDNCLEKRRVFKWIKQKLRIKTFLGTSRNAVMTPIWIAICVYLLLAYLNFVSRLATSLQHILRFLQLNLFERRDLLALLRDDPPETAYSTLQTALRMKSPTANSPKGL